MKKKTTILTVIFILFGVGLEHMQSQNLSLNIKNSDNSEKSIQLSLLKKITFSGTNLVLNYQSGSFENTHISLIQNLTFSSFTEVRNVIEDTNSIAVYPNPSSNFIFFKNLPEGSFNITVCSMNGMKMMNVFPVNNRIDISRLTNGIYLIKVNNQILKLSKR